MYPYPANDNDNDYESDPDEPGYDHSDDSPKNVCLLLKLAGFDPGLIPEEERPTALAVVRLWENDVFDRDEIEETLGCRPSDLRKAVKALRVAANTNGVHFLFHKQGSR